MSTLSKSSTKRTLLVILNLIAAVFFLSSSAVMGQSSSYPTRPITLLVPVSAGGSMDLTARTLAEGSQQILGQPFMVVNKAGGGTAIATAELVQAKPDGYTIAILYGAGLSYVPQLRKVNYNGPEDVQPIIQTIDSSLCAMVAGDAPWKTMKEVIDYAKNNPWKLKVGSAGAGSLSEMVVKRVEQVTGAKMTDVPLSGAASEQEKAVMGKHVDLAYTTAGSITGLVEAGKLRALALCNTERMGGWLSPVPTMRELGYDVVTVSSYFFMGGPKGLPKEIAQKLYDTFYKVLKGKQFREMAEKNNWIMDNKGPDELMKQLKQDYAYYSDFIKMTQSK